METFETGKAYFATPVLEGAKRQVAVILARDGRNMSIVTVRAISVGRVKCMSEYGREFVQFETSDGQTFNMSACAEVPLEQSAEILSVLRQAAGQL